MTLINDREGEKTTLIDDYMKSESRTVVVSIFIILIPVIVAVVLFLLSGFFGWFPILAILLMIIALVIVIVGTPIVFALVVYFILAPKDIFFTFVQEGTAKIVLRNEAYQKTLMSLEGFELENRFIVPGKAGSKGLFKKGLFFLGIWPFDRIYKYAFTWTSIDAKGLPRVHEEREVDYIFLKKDVYFIRLIEGEDRDGLPLKVDIVLTMSIISPFVALMQTDRWLDAISNFILAEIRSELTKYPYAELINRNASKRGLGEEIYCRLNSKPGCAEDQVDCGIVPQEGSDFEYVEKHFGVRIQKLGVAAIDPPAEWRAITLKKYTATKEAEATQVTAEVNAKVTRITADASADAIRTIGVANSEQQAETTAGSVTRAFLKALGATYEAKDDEGKIRKNISQSELSGLIAKNPEIWKSCEEMVRLKIKVDNKAYVQVEGSNGQPMGTLTEMLAASKFFEVSEVFGKKPKDENSIPRVFVSKGGQEVKKDQKSDARRRKQGNDAQLKDEFREAVEAAGLDPEDAIE